jgi:hypothetical protein
MHNTIIDKELWIDILDQLNISKNNQEKLLIYINNNIHQLSSTPISTNSFDKNAPSRLILGLKVLSEINNLSKIHIVDSPLNKNLLTWNKEYSYNKEDIETIPNLEYVIHLDLVKDTVKILNDILNDHKIYLYQLFSNIKYEDNIINVFHRYYFK